MGTGQELMKERVHISNIVNKKEDIIINFIVFNCSERVA